MSDKTRRQIVELAVSQAGRGSELYSQATTLLEDMLKSWAIKYRFPILRTIPSVTSSLSAGAATAAIPTDCGWGVEGILFGTEETPLDEMDLDYFLFNGGKPKATDSAGRPTKYLFDKPAGYFRFDRFADQAYVFLPIYYKIPTRGAAFGNDAADSATIWMDDDDLVRECLIERIYQYKEDGREIAQSQREQARIAQYFRGVAPMGNGSSSIRLSRRRFR